jgi:hypothetical protein
MMTELYNYKIAKSKHIKLDNAIRIVNEKGRVLKKDILKTIKVNQIVRISMHISKKSPYDCRLLRDSPYVKIIEINKQNILGQILDEMRTLPDNYYPLRSKEHIWFKSNNIIEFMDLPEDLEKKYGTNDFIPYTGPLETIDSDCESSDYHESEDSSASDSEEEKNINLSKKNPKAPLLRGRPNAF